MPTYETLVSFLVPGDTEGLRVSEVRTADGSRALVEITSQAGSTLASATFTLDQLDGAARVFKMMVNAMKGKQ